MNLLLWIVQVLVAIAGSSKVFTDERARVGLALVAAYGCLVVPF